jgi:PTH1 family peptidyl-tRNA hydrolase
MKIIIGLGNPGKEYHKTRHNIGFLVLDELHKQLGSSDISAWTHDKKFQAEVCGVTYKNEKIILVKPQTYMNDSGVSVQQIMHFYKATVRDIIVVHDDKDIPLGEIKVQINRGSAGHNGIKSIIEHLSTQDFTRVRIGIRSDNEKKMKDTPKFVLGKFGLFERGAMKKSIDEAARAVFKIIETV